MTNSLSLNARSYQRLDAVASRSEELRIARQDVPEGGTLWDFGVHQHGGLQAGLELAALTVADLAEVQIVPGSVGEEAWPAVQVRSDHPLAACLFSQYAGWEIKTETFFALGSGPMRAVSAHEPLFERWGYREKADRVVGVLETGQLPGCEVFAEIAQQCDLPVQNVTLAVAPVCSLAGTIQVVSRSVETALHKLQELGFDVSRVQTGWGVAPLPPVATDDLTGIGRTNDAILYGAVVDLWVAGDEESLREIGPRVPSESSAGYGRPFVEIFEAAGRDFYNIDPHLFSPAVVRFHSLESGRIHVFGQRNETVLRDSFGL